MKLMKMNLQYFAGIPDIAGPGGKKKKSPLSTAKSSKKKGSKASKSKKSKSSKSSSTPEGITEDQRLSFETGTGLPFSGSMAAQLVHAIMFRFILGDSDLNQNVGKIDLLYHYRFFTPPLDNSGHRKVQYLNVRQLIDVNIPDDAENWIIKHHNKYNIFNPDEAMSPDPQRFLQYEGTLDQFIRDVSNPPFNEVYWTHEEEYDHQETVGAAQRSAMSNLPSDPYEGSPGNFIFGKDWRIPHATMHFRQTPFQPAMWRQLPVVSIYPSDVVDISLDRNDSEQKSVFNITNDGMDLNDITNLPPVTDDREELERRYGYAYMNVTSDYFLDTVSFSGLNAQQLTLSMAKQDHQTIPYDYWITFPSVTTFNDYFGPDGATQLEGEADPHLMQEMPMSPQEGGSSLYYQTLGYLEKHMNTFFNDEVEYEIAVLITTFVDSLSGTSKNPAYVSNPAQLPSGAQFRQIVEKTKSFGTQEYSKWITDLTSLKNADQATSQNISVSLDHDLQNIVRNPNNVYRTYNTNTGSYEKDNGAPDPVITYQKAGQLVMHYVLIREREGGDSIASFLKNSGVTALNPWLKKVEKAPKTKTKKGTETPEEASTKQEALTDLSNLGFL